jgi:hypothetical protein
MHLILFERRVRPFIACLALAACTTARAEPLPYTTRVHEYNGWNTTVSGDVRTVGMAGATIGLPDSYLSSRDNPSGLALLMGDADENYSNNEISDGHIQSRGSPIDMGSFGVAAAFYPWAFSVGYVTTSREGMPYELPNSPEAPTLGISAREWRFGVSRVFFSNRVSLGASFNFGRAVEDLEFEQSDAETLSGSEHELSLTLGILGQLNRHVLIGASYAFPMTYDFTDASGPATPIAGFYKPLTTPGRVGMGVGWVPNRIFRADVSMHVVGRTRGAALLRDDTSLVGQNITVQPRAGLAYIFADFEEFRGTSFIGSYLEMTRIDNTSSRLHFTGGVEIKPWILTLGAGLDIAPRYSNVLLGFGIDLIKVAQKLSIIPKPYSPPRKGLLPPAAKLSDEGLPRGLVEHWRPKGPDMNVIKVIGDIPERTERKVEDVKEVLREQGFIDPKPTPTPKAKSKPKRKGKGASQPQPKKKPATSNAKPKPAKRVAE